MADFKLIEKNIKIYEKIKAIDKDIIQLEKLGRLINDGEVCVLDLSVRKPQEKKEESKETEYVTFEYRPYMMFDMGCGSSKKKEEPKENFNSVISETLSYEVLGLLINKKIEDRNKLIAKLK